MAVPLPESINDPVRDVIARLQSPVPDLSTLLSLLCTVLDALKLLEPHYKKHASGLVPQGALNLRRHVPPLQRALLEHVIPIWESTLVEEGKATLLVQLFCPEIKAATPNANVAGEIALLAYSTLLSLPLTDFSVRMLERLCDQRCYPVDRLHSEIFSASNSDKSEKKLLIWADCVRNVVAVPSKVANATGKSVPSALEQGVYFDRLSQRCEFLLFTMSHNPSSQENISALTLLVTKLANVGLFPSHPPTARSQCSFWQSNLPIISRRLRSERGVTYASLFSKVLQSVSSAMVQQTVFVSLLASIDVLKSPLNPSASQRALIKRNAVLLLDIVGRPSSETQELWENVSAVLLDRPWNESVARILACWVAGAGHREVDYEALDIFLAKVVEIWSSPEYIKHALLAQHHYLTTLLLVTASYFPASSPQLMSLALSSAFISGIGCYISGLDHSVRRCGMLAAEVIAHRTDKKLDFGDWEGSDHGKPWARQLRLLISARDVDVDLEILKDVPLPVDQSVDKIVGPEMPHAGEYLKSAKPKAVILKTGYDSDDSLTGYASPPSSRSASPTPSELEEIERDPTLRVGIKKIPRPVYLVQLGELVRNTGGKSGEPQEEADKIEMALNCGEELIRKKQGYGVELEENAANLVYGFVGLHDNFDLADFETKRQGILMTLASCCPKVAAPSMIEEFFKNQYSTGQRYSILNALALAARELASLPVPTTLVQPQRSGTAAFPSKKLPAALHQKYLAEGGQDTDPVKQLLDGISSAAIDRGKDATADKVPNLVRERQLRLRKPTKISEVRQGTVAMAAQPPTRVLFTEVAAECFIAPMINRFWLFLRNEQTREVRTAFQEPLYRYKGGGAGLILNPIVLTHFLSTLAILMHASQNAPQWLAILAPDALELAVTLGTRPISQSDEDGQNTDEQSKEHSKQASVLTTALELVLVVLDGCLELDDGKSIGLDHTTLLLGAGEWAQDIFSNLEKGTRVEGGGGSQEIRLKRAAAGVLLKVDELTSRWRRSMVDVR